VTLKFGLKLGLKPNSSTEFELNFGFKPKLVNVHNAFSWAVGPYPGIAPGGYFIHYTNTNPNPYPGANTG